MSARGGAPEGPASRAHLQMTWPIVDRGGVKKIAPPSLTSRNFRYPSINCSVDAELGKVEPFINFSRRIRNLRKAR